MPDIGTESTPDTSQCSDRNKDFDLEQDNIGDLFADSEEINQSSGILDIEQSITLTEEDEMASDLPSNQLGLGVELSDDSPIVVDPDSPEENGGNTFMVLPKKTTNRQPTITYEDFATLLDKKLDKFATKSEIEDTLLQVKANTLTINDNRKDILALRTDIASLKEAALKPPLLCERQSSPDNMHQPQTFRAGARNAEQEKARIKKFEHSRKSLRIWPIPRTTQSEISRSLRNFLSEALEIDRTDVDCLGVQYVERVQGKGA